jgi:predicted ThiF/HesA family dinucleotide-utilizing enzyme
VADTKLSVQEEREAVRLEREKVRLQKERRELELIEGKSIPRAEVELMIVGRAVAMLSHLKAMTQMRASDWIHIVDGDQSRAAELIAEIQDGIEEYLATFARDVEFKVMLAPAGDAPAQPDDLDDSDE